VIEVLFRKMRKEVEPSGYRLSKGLRTGIRRRKKEIRRDGGDETELLNELTLPQLVILVLDSGVGPQRFRNALKDLNINNLDSTRRLLEISEDIGSDSFPYKNERLLDVTQQALRAHVIELERREVAELKRKRN